MDEKLCVGEAKVQVLERRKTKMEDKMKNIKYGMEEMKKNIKTFHQHHRGWTEISQHCF